MSRRVFITGVGVVSSLGLGRRPFWDAIVAGRSGLSPITSFDAAPLGRTLAAQVQGFVPADHLTAREQRHVGRCGAMSLAAARMAVADASLAPEALAHRQACVVMGTTMGEADALAVLDTAWIRQGPEAVSARAVPRYAPYLGAMHLARAFKTRGLVLTLPAACAAGNYALGYASDLLRAGRAEVALAGAAEMLEALQFAGFVRLGAVAPERCQPFDLHRQGLIVGEGAAVFVLESEDHAVRRGASVLAELGGYGIACDAYHVTRPRPDGLGNARAMREAVSRSGLSLDAVDFINAHGTGTRANDAVEATVIREVFAGRRVPVTSVKSMIGHCMGASSALEAVTCIETLRTGFYPPTVGYDTPDPECDLDVVANASRRGKADVVLNNALAFGGYDAVTCFARPGVLPPPEGPGARAAEVGS